MMHISTVLPAWKSVVSMITDVLDVTLCFFFSKFCHIEMNTIVVDILASTALQKY